MKLLNWTLQFLQISRSVDSLVLCPLRFANNFWAAAHCHCRNHKNEKYVCFFFLLRIIKLTLHWVCQPLSHSHLLLACTVTARSHTHTMAVCQYVLSAPLLSLSPDVMVAAPQPQEQQSTNNRCLIMSIAHWTSVHRWPAIGRPTITFHAFVWASTTEWTNWLMYKEFTRNWSN